MYQSIMNVFGVVVNRLFLFRLYEKMQYEWDKSMCSLSHLCGLICMGERERDKRSPGCDKKLVNVFFMGFTMDF